MIVEFVDLQKRASLPPSAVAIGAFDGVHLGHRALLARLSVEAEESHLVRVVLSFDRHPAAVVSPESSVKLLSNLDQKLELLEATGMVDQVVVLTFDEERSKETAADFVSEVVVAQCNAKKVVVGENFLFGHGRTGDVALLSEMGREGGFDVAPVALTGEIEAISSTVIRELVASGEVEEAAKLLSRNHEIRGYVVHGDGRGAELGYPTANIAVPDEMCVPGDGIYSGFLVDSDGVARPAAISIGTRPTFNEGDSESVVEAYVLNFDADLYDHHVGLQFGARLRDQKKFDSIEDLVAQIDADVAQVLTSLSLRD